MKLFGTDGVRGVANTELTPELGFYLGRAAGSRLASRHNGHKPRLLVGRDTRASGDLLEAALIAGAMSAGIDCEVVGVVPTPGVAYLTKALGFDAGVMVSASHNPVEDNGIKFFSSSGYKLTDEEEEEVERIVRGLERGEDRLPRPSGTSVGRRTSSGCDAQAYADFLASTFDLDLTGKRVVLDCGNGAAYTIAPEVFRRLGADVVALNTECDGARINVHCGSTQPKVAQEAVVRLNADVGFTFDGDADRVLAVDENGDLVDGDHILAILGTQRLKEGNLPGGAVAATTYSNLGLKLALEAAGGRMVETAAGDRYVLEAMLQDGLVLGGEQSGHVILLEHNTTGDGILTALALLASIGGRRLCDAKQVMTPLPQSLVNVRVKAKDALGGNESIANAVRAAQARLGNSGRIFVRASGTEPVVRVLGEGVDRSEVEAAVASVARTIAQELG